LEPSGAVTKIKGVIMMEQILVTLAGYVATNPLPMTDWPQAKVAKRARAVQYKVDLDLYNAGLPYAQLATQPRYFLRSRVFPIATWEKAVEIEMERLGVTVPPAKRPQDNWTTAWAYAQTYSRNQGPSYLRKVQAHAEKTDPLPAGPYGTRRPEIWAVSFLKIRP
jgi:hypothetical protein